MSASAGCGHAAGRLCAEVPILQKSQNTGDDFFEEKKLKLSSRALDQTDLDRIGGATEQNRYVSASHPAPARASGGSVLVRPTLGNRLNPQSEKGTASPQ
jgi:hypothetical protein